MSSSTLASLRKKFEGGGKGKRGKREKKENRGICIYIFFDVFSSSTKHHSTYNYLISVFLISIY